jgi:hypothetical protein
MSDYGERRAKLFCQFKDDDEFPSGTMGWEMFLIERIALLSARCASLEAVLTDIAHAPDNISIIWCRRKAIDALYELQEKENGNGQ